MYPPYKKVSSFCSLVWFKLNLECQESVISLTLDENVSFEQHICEGIYITQYLKIIGEDVLLLDIFEDLLGVLGSYCNPAFYFLANNQHRRHYFWPEPRSSAFYPFQVK